MRIVPIRYTPAELSQMIGDEEGMEMRGTSAVRRETYVRIAFKVVPNLPSLPRCKLMSVS
jgi:hypothetical protein